MRFVIRKIAENEFKRIINHPIVLIITFILFIYSIINGIGSYYLLPQLSHLNLGDLFLIGFRNNISDITLILSFLSLCIGVVLISEDRSTGRLRILMTKPVYLKEIIVGKFIGLNLSIFIISMLATIFNVFMLAMIYRPFQSYDTLIRILIIALLLYMLNVLIATIVIFIGTILKNMYAALVATSAFLYLIWFVFPPYNLGELLKINPIILYQNIIAGGGTNLLDTSNSLDSWAFSSLPLIGILLTEILIFLIINIHYFGKEET